MPSRPEATFPGYGAPFPGYGAPPRPDADARTFRYEGPQPEYDTSPYFQEPGPTQTALSRQRRARRRRIEEAREERERLAELNRIAYAEQLAMFRNTVPPQPRRPYEQLPDARAEARSFEDDRPFEFQPVELPEPEEPLEPPPFVPDPVPQPFYSVNYPRPKLKQPQQGNIVFAADGGEFETTNPMGAFELDPATMLPMKPTPDVIFGEDSDGDGIPNPEEVSIKPMKKTRQPRPMRTRGIKQGSQQAPPFPGVSPYESVAMRSMLAGPAMDNLLMAAKRPIPARTPFLG